MWTTPYLDALVEPVDGVLAPLGFRLTAQDDNLRLLLAAWATDAVVVNAWYEPPDHWGDVHIGRRRDDDQPPWSLVPLSEILCQRRAGSMPTSAQQRESFAMPADVRAWAEIAAELLATQTDLLRGQNLEVIDRLISEMPRDDDGRLDLPK